MNLGVAGPTTRTPVDGTVSVNWQITWNPPWKADDESRKLILPYVTAGYTRYFVTGNALNYGAGVIWRLKGGGTDSDNNLQIEYREVHFPGGQRIPSIRIAYLSNAYM